MTCQACGGIVGQDCFNPEECAWITQQMVIEAASQPAQGRADRLASRVNDLEQWQREAREAIGVLDVGGWEWTMLPNGDRGWSFNGYLRDHELRRLLNCGDGIMPKELA